MADPTALLDAIATQLGEPVPALPELALGTATPGPLVAGEEPRLFAALVELTRRRERGFADAVAGEIATWLGTPGQVTFYRHAGAALTAACGDGTAVAMGPLADVPEPLRVVPRHEALAQLTDARVLVFEPRFESDEDETALRAVLAATRAAGLRIIADETRTAGRTAPGSACIALGLPFDELVLGASLAVGRPLGIRVQRGETSARVVDANALSLLLAGATARVLREAPASAALAVHGASLRTAFLAACAREAIEAAVVGPPALGRFVLHGQEGVSAELLTSHAGLEIERLGAAASLWIVPHAGWDQQAPRLHAILDAAVARLRTGLVEANSYLSGGLPFVFPAGEPALRARGLAIYRFPRLGPVDVFAQADRIHIRFARGDLGPIVSSGFYVPTRLHGDFEASIEYELHGWDPGPDAACFALFFQNELSTGRYYAQRTTGSDGAHRVHSGFDGVLSAAQTVTGARGAFRLARTGARVSAWHRAGENGPWVDLGTTEQATTDDGILGAKIWAKVACGGLEASLFDLRARATLAATQDPMPTAVPDPRGASS